jgi:hypothetical protein
VKRIALALLWSLALVLTLTSFQSVSGQSKRTSKSKKSAPAPKPTPAADFTVQRTKVAEQISIITRFIFVYGKITNGFETAFDQEKSKQTSPEIIAKVQQARDKLAANIGNLKIGLSDLARTFQSDSRLQVQYLKLTGASDAVSTAQSAVTANRFEDGGKALILSVEKLTDTLIALK